MPRYCFHLEGGDLRRGFRLHIELTAPSHATAEALAEAKGRAILEALEADPNTLQVTPALPAPEGE